MRSNAAPLLLLRRQRTCQRAIPRPLRRGALGARLLSTQLPARSSLASSRARWLALAGTALVLGAACGTCLAGRPAQPAECSEEARVFTRAQVKEHNTRESLWVTYRNKVYDVTEFLEGHPGGDRLLLAAGGAIDPFWRLYKQHQVPEVFEILDQYYVGDLHPSEPPLDVDVTEMDAFANDPKRLASLPVYSLTPFNAGTIMELISEDRYVTPNDMFYVRNHHPVPDIDPGSYQLKLGSGKTLSLNDLRTRYPASEITSTLICAGNRRDEFNLPGQGGVVQGLRWKSDSVSTARWKGVWLREFKSELLRDFPVAAHCCFVGHDAPYDASVPVGKAFEAGGDVLIAYEMNGEPIPRDHGGPVRLVVPGYVAARSVKWLTEIYVSDEESRSAWQRGGAYKSFGPSVKSLNAFDAEKYPSVQEMPVQSAITSYTLQQGGKLQVTGWAWSGGGRAIVRVEVSNDGGEMWEEAELTMGSRQPRGRAWAWTMWKVSVPVAEPGKRELVVRAVDESFSCQPERPKAVWNLRGILNNSYHRMSYEAGLHA